MTRTQIYEHIFDENDDSEWWIEVKTTGLGKHFPFYVTANEVRCSEDCPERFRLYRVFDFARDPRIYVVGGALSVACVLEPATVCRRLPRSIHPSLKRDSRIAGPVPQSMFETTFCRSTPSRAATA